MEPITQTLKKKTSEMEGAWKVLRNILEFSVEDRLQNIKQAIPLKLSKLEQRHYAPAASDSTTEADPIPALGAGPVFLHQHSLRMDHLVHMRKRSGSATTQPTNYLG